MKEKNRNTKRFGFIVSMMLIFGLGGLSVPQLAAQVVILNPGSVAGTVTATGQNITKVTVHAIDTDGLFSASASFPFVPPSSGDLSAPSIDYDLTVEGDRNYLLIAEISIAGPGDRSMITPIHGGPSGVFVPIAVPIPGDPPTPPVPLDINVVPGFISGTISTVPPGANEIDSFSINANVFLTAFARNFSNRTFATISPPEPGLSQDYTLLVAPGFTYNENAFITVNGFLLFFGDFLGSEPAPAAGETLVHDFVIPVEATPSTIFGTARLNGLNTNVFSASVTGFIPSPFVSANTLVQADDTYSLDVIAGTWQVQPFFSYTLTVETGTLSGVFGNLRPPRESVVVGVGDNILRDFIIDPGFITGTVTFTGTNTDIDLAQLSARSVSGIGGTMAARVQPDTGEYMYVASPGDWENATFFFQFPYESDPDTSLTSTILQFAFSGALPTVSASVTTPDNLTFGTATVRLLYTVADGSELRSPEIVANRVRGGGDPVITASGRGSSAFTTAGQAIVTLFPGTWNLEAFAIVGVSRTEFGTFSVTAAEGDSVVIGGLSRPTVTVTSPTDGQEVAASSVTVVGTATDDVGISSIFINGLEVSFSSTNNLDDPNEVGFSHEVSLPMGGANTIDVVVQDIDGTLPVTLSLTVFRTTAETTFVNIDIKPGSDPNCFNVNGNGVIPVAILGSADFDVLDIDKASLSFAGLEVRMKGKKGPLCHAEDTNDDGISDLVCQFEDDPTTWTPDSTAEATVTGTLFGGTPFEGTDFICVTTQPVL